MQQDRNTENEDRPLTARSVLASTLLGMDPPESSARLLARSGELFGIAEGTTRTALSRMVAAGELEPAGDGRYRLSGRLLARQTRQRQSRRPELRRWDGEWRTAIVVAEGRSAAARAALRAGMTAARMAELREGCWLRPDNLAVTPEGPVAEQCRWFVGHPAGGDADAVALAASLWDLRAWAGRAGHLLGRMDATAPSLRAGDVAVLAPCFVLAASVLRHLQADPLLPDELLPATWPGASLRAAYDEYEQALQGLLRAWHRANRDH